MKGTAFAARLQDHLFLNQPITNHGDASGLLGSAAAGNYYCRLHTADPSAGTGTTSETAYTNYAGGVALARGSAGFQRSGVQVSNVAKISFPQNTGSLATEISHWSICTAATGAAEVVKCGELLGAGVVVTVDATLTNDRLLASGNPFTDGQAVRVRVKSGTIPGGLSTALQYFIRDRDANGFKLTASWTGGGAGAVVDITSLGDGLITVHLDGHIIPNTNVTPEIGIGMLIDSEV